MVLHNPNNWHWVNKDATEWTRQWLEESLSKLEAEDGEVTASVGKIVSMDGDVEVSQRKGRLIAVYDFKLVVEYTGSTADEEDVTGTITFPEVMVDDDDIHYELESFSDPKGADPVKALVRSKLIPQIQAQFSKLTAAVVEEHGKDIQHAPGSNPSSGFSTPKYIPQTASSSKLAEVQPAAAESSVGALKTGSFTREEKFGGVRAEQIYGAFTAPQFLRGITGSAPDPFKEADTKTEFKLFGGNVLVKYLVLEPPNKIVMNWQEDFKAIKKHPTRVELSFKQTEDGVTMNVDWTEIPIAAVEDTQIKFQKTFLDGLHMIAGQHMATSAF